MEKSNIITEITQRLVNLEEAVKGTKKKPAGKKGNKPDEEVCPECGGDLLWVEDGVVYCSKCKEYYEAEEE